MNTKYLHGELPKETRFQPYRYDVSRAQHIIYITSTDEECQKLIGIEVENQTEI